MECIGANSWPTGTVSVGSDLLKQAAKCLSWMFWQKFRCFQSHREHLRGFALSGEFLFRNIKWRHLGRDRMRRLTGCQRVCQQSMRPFSCHLQLTLCILQGRWKIVAMSENQLGKGNAKVIIEGLHLRLDTNGSCPHVSCELLFVEDILPVVAALCNYLQQTWGSWCELSIEWGITRGVARNIFSGYRSFAESVVAWAQVQTDRKGSRRPWREKGPNDVLWELFY